MRRARDECGSDLEATLFQTTCGIPAVIYGELISAEEGVPSACHCHALCVSHVPEGCRSYKSPAGPESQSRAGGPPGLGRWSLGERTFVAPSERSRFSETVKIWEMYWFLMKLALFWLEPTELMDSAASCSDMFSDLRLDSRPFEFLEGSSSLDFKLL